MNTQVESGVPGTPRRDWNSERRISRSSHRRRHRPRFRFHQRLPRHRQRHGHLDRYRGAQTPCRGDTVRDSQPGRRVPVGRGGGDRCQGNRQPHRHRRAGVADHRLRGPRRWHLVESRDLAARHSVEFVARPLRRADRRDHRGPGDERCRVVGRDEQDRHPRRPRTRRRSSGRCHRHLADLSHHRRRRGKCQGGRIPLGADRVGVPGLTRARHQRCSEDDGHHLSGAGGARHHHGRHGDAVLGEILLRPRDRSGTYLGGWRIIRTLGKGLVEITSPQGMAAEAPRPRSSSPPVTSACRCRPRRRRPDPSSERESASPGRRSGGASPDAWRSRGCSPFPPPLWSGRCAG